MNNANNATGATADIADVWGTAASGTLGVLDATMTNNTLTNNSTTGGHVLDVLNSSAGDGETLNSVPLRRSPRRHHPDSEVYWLPQR